MATVEPQRDEAQSAKEFASLLCVHGVGGAEPQDILDRAPRPEPVAAVGPGAGFFDGELNDLPATVYVWGGLTSGRRFPQLDNLTGPRGGVAHWFDLFRHVSWILLTPYSLLNVAVQMVGPRSDEAGARVRSTLLAMGLLMTAFTALSALQLADYLTMSTRFRELFVTGVDFGWGGDLPILAVRIVLLCASALMLLALIEAMCGAPRSLRAAPDSPTLNRASGLGRMLAETEASPWPHRLVVFVLLGVYVGWNGWHGAQALAKAESFALRPSSGSPEVRGMVTEWSTRELQNVFLYNEGQALCSSLYLLLGIAYAALAFSVLGSPGAWRNRTRRGGLQSGVAAAVITAPLLLVFEVTLLGTAIVRLVPVEDSSPGGPAALTLNNPMAVAGAFVAALGISALLLIKVWLAGRSGVSDLFERYPGDIMTKRDVRRVLRKKKAASLGSTAHNILLAIAAGTLAGYVLEFILSATNLLASNPSLMRARSELGERTALVVASVSGALIAFLWKSIRSSRARQSSSIIWDVVTFWPRAIHPWGVPWTGRRAVLEVSNQLSEMTKIGRVVLWTHSQGSVIAVAALGTLTVTQRGSVDLVTCGSPLRTLYSQHFPAYWNPTTTSDLASEVGIWVNYYRVTDYVGRKVFFEPGNPEDSVLLDPSEKDAREGMRAPRAHSEYWTDPDILHRVKELVTGVPEDAPPDQAHKTP